MADVKAARARLAEIRAQINELNLEAERILIANSDEPHPEGEGACTVGIDGWHCAKYKYPVDRGSGNGICARLSCQHAAYLHEF